MIMKKTITRKESEYVAPEMEVVVLAAEQSVIMSSTDPIGDDDDI